MPSAPKAKSINVYARWRPLAQSEAANGEISRSAKPDDRSRLSVSISGPASSVNSSWTSQPAYDAVLGPGDDNTAVYETIVAPAIPKVLEGGNCTFFAYGHSGSGKTHTIIGYDHDSNSKIGLCLAAARQLFEALESLNVSSEHQLGIGISLFELRRKSAFDLLSQRTEC